MIDCPSFHVKLGENIRAERNYWHLSQAQLGDKIGVHRNTISRWESGEEKVDFLGFMLLCGALMVLPSKMLPPKWTYGNGRQRKPPVSAVELERDPKLSKAEMRKYGLA